MQQHTSPARLDHHAEQVLLIWSRLKNSISMCARIKSKIYRNLCFKHLKSNARPFAPPRHHPASLEDLNARKNFLAALPVGLCHLQCLRKLDVAHNPLNEMPDSWHKQVPSPSTLTLTSTPASK